MAGEEPPYLTVGTDVSAKYKGAFCEAKIKKVTRSVKCKLTFKNNVGVAIVTDDLIRGTLRVGAHVEAKHPEKNQYLEAVINKLNDYSQYTVVFDDGDETTLRRTSLCLKSGRHFAESETLDQLPLTHPEHFGNPVMNSKGRRSRTTTRSPAVDESSDEEQSSKKKETKAKPTDPDIGKVICVESTDKKKNKENWFPALIISPKCQDSLRVRKQEEYLVRSFRDGKYHVVSKKDSKEFTRDLVNKVENNPLKTAVEKVLTYLDKDELPNHWDRDVLFGLENSSNEESDQGTDSDTSDDEPSEVKDHFVAQLYKFMDDRGTPINKAPTVSNRDLNLYKLYKVVQKAGGYNRVTNQMQWKTVYAKMGFPPGNSTSSHQIKQAYKKYLHSFEEFKRKLGISMGSSTRSGRGRYRSERYLLLSRDQHFKGTRRRNPKSDVKSVPNEKDSEKAKVQEEDEVKSVDAVENKSESQEKDVNEESTDSNKLEVIAQESKKTETIKIKQEKEEESDDESKGDKDESESETPKAEPKLKAKSKNVKEEETPQPKRRGRKKVEKAPSADEDESSNNNDDDEEDCRDSLNISIGDRVKVKYGRGRQQKIYEAKVLKLGEEDSDKEYFVHYTGWNMRYDEWVKRHRIVKNLSQKGSGRRPRSTTPAKSAKVPAKKGRPQGSVVPKKESTSDRKSVTPTSSLRSRGSRGDKSNNDSPSNVDQKRITRHSSLQRDVSDDSDSADSAENQQQRRTKRSSGRKSSQLDDAEPVPSVKSEEEEVEEATSSKETDDGGKKSASKSESVKKDSSSSSKEKVDVKVTEEDENKKQVKKVLKERQKSEEIVVEQTEESPKTTRRPRGRPPRQGGEEKKPTAAEKKAISRSESDSKDDTDQGDTEAQTKLNLDDVTEESRPVSKEISALSEMLNLKEDEDPDSSKSSVEKIENEDIEVGHSDKDEPDVSSIENEPELSASPAEYVKDDFVNDVKVLDEVDGTQLNETPPVSDPVTEEPKLELLCDEDLAEGEDSSGEDSPAAVSIPETAVTVTEAAFPALESVEKMDIVVQSPSVCHAEASSDEPLMIAEETPVSELGQNSVIVEQKSTAVVDKFDLMRLETAPHECEKFLKKEIPALNEVIQTTTSEKLVAAETCGTAKSNELDVYEYSEESFEEKINFKENVLKKLERAGVAETVETAEVTGETCLPANKEAEKVVEIENKMEGVTVIYSYLSPAEETTPVVEPHSEIKSEKCDVKLEVASGPSPGPSFVPHVSSSSSSKSVKKEKKRKNHKNEKRKMLVEAGDTSEDGSGNEEPKSKKRKNRDEECGSKKESKGKDPKQKKSRDKRNKSKGDREELKLLKKKCSAEKSRRKECKKKKESPEKSRKERDEETKLVVDSDDISSVSSDSCQRKEKKKSRKHQHRCEKNRDESEKKRMKKYKSFHDDDATSDEGNRGKKSRREEKSKSKRKRDKGKVKEFPVSSEDSNSSKVSAQTAKSKEKLGEKLEKSNKSEDPECDMSKYLMCEEKVPASPVGMNDVPDVSSGMDERTDTPESVKGKENVRSKANDATVAVSAAASVATTSFGVHSPHQRHLKLDVSDTPPTVIDNTPPTTPESSGTAGSEPLHHDNDSPSYMSPNDTDSNQLVTTGKSSQSSSPHDYSDEADRCRELLIDETDNRAEMMAIGSDEGEREDAKVANVFGSASMKRSTMDHDEQTPTRKRKKRHRKHSSSLSESNKHGSPLDGSSSNRQSSKHLKGVDVDEIPSSTSESSLTSSGLLLGRLNPTGGFTDPSNLPHPTRPSRFNFYVELDDYADGDQRIAVIQERLTELRRTYMALKAEVACIDRRRKKLKKKEKEASSSTAVATTIVECN